ncbi:MAG TPA: hypothetical protein VLI90_12935 [Tepidisphaeraceae bacterium]|nr:hypothetical protein [Tepidisphaeraceae bacterium]
MAQMAAAPALLAAGAALLVYAITLAGTYVYDDLAIVTLDPRVKSPALWSQFWTKDYFNGGLDNLYRPLVSMSYGIQWWLHGDRPWAFHLVNWLLHAAVAAAVAELTRRTVGRGAAYIAGLLFAVHPVHVEAVANIVGRAELACALGILAALTLFAKRPLTFARVMGIVVCEIVAVLSKEQGILVPPMLAIYFWFVWRDDPRGAADSAAERAALRWLVISVTWCTAGYLIWREHFLRFDWDRSFLDWVLQPMVRCSPHDRVLMPLVLLGHYTQLLICPVKLSPDYGAKVIGWTVRLTDPYFGAGVAVALLWLIFTAIAIYRRRGFEAFCLLSLALSYGMIANVIAILGCNMAERWIYLPSAFFLMWLAIWIAGMPRPARLALLIAIVTLASARTFTYARRWNDRLTFYEQSLDEQPNSVQLYLLTAGELDARHDYAAADAVMARAAAVFPDAWHVWMRRAVIAMDAGRLDDADRYLRRSFELSPNPMVIAVSDRLDQLKAARKAAATTPSKMTPRSGSPEGARSSP